MNIVVLKQRAHHCVTDHNIRYFKRLQLQRGESEQSKINMYFVGWRHTAHTGILGDKVHFV
jgi:hypothetical protein